MNMGKNIQPSPFNTIGTIPNMQCTSMNQNIIPITAVIVNAIH